MMYSRDVLRRFALDQLDGVGDPSLGQWEEHGAVFHVRRRLSVVEAAAIGPVVDIRGTAEAIRRWRAVERFLPEGLREIR